MPDEIIELLKNKKLRDVVVNTIKSVYNYAGTLHDNPSEDMGDMEEGQLWWEAWWRAEIHGKIEKIKEAFEKYVFNKMQKPYRIYPDELLNKFYDFVRPGGCGSPELENIDFDDLYTVFIHNVQLNVLSFKRSRPIPICILKVYKSEKDENEDILLWQYNGIRVCLLERRPKTRWFISQEFYLDAVVEGCISDDVNKYLETAIGEVFRTSIRSFSLLNEDNKPVNNITETLNVNEEDIGKAKDVIKQYLDAYFIEPSKKDTFDKRIHNSVQLLIESDLQRNDAVALALSITSIEALLGEKSENICDKLATNVAVLLEPDLKYRMDAIKFMKNIYNHRSRALHGETLDSEYNSRDQSRHLAAAVLSSIILRKDFKKRFGEKPETIQNLLEDLSNSRFNAGAPIGIPEYNVRQYWTKTK